MITALVILTSIVVFFIALFSPARATRIQVHAHRLRLNIQNRARWQPRVVRWAMNIPSGISHFAIHHSIRFGKKSRRKLPF